MPRDRSRSGDRARSMSPKPHRSSRDSDRDRDRDRERARENDNHHSSSRHDRRSHRSHRHRSLTTSHSRSRSRSHDRHHHHHHHRSSHRHRSRERSSRHDRTPRPGSPPPVLPGNARPITKHDYGAYKALFAEYLDIQKGLMLGDLSDREVKGRFKRFVTHWNRGELAKGWYDPSRKASATPTITTAAADEASNNFLDRMSHSLDSRKKANVEDEEDKDGSGSDDSSDDEIVGPLPPGYEASGASKRGKKASASMPTVEDLDLQKEQLSEARLASIEELRASRKADRALQKERLEDVLPRPAAGSHEAKMEKKKLLNEKLRSFREKSPDMEVPEAEMMGGGGGTDSFKQLKAAKERKKNERELRKEAMLRQRMEEREVRLRMHREKEERTIAMLKALADSAQRGGGR